MKRSSASKRLADHSAGSPCLARPASRALTGKIGGFVPSAFCAASPTKVNTSSSSEARSKMSILLTMTTTFFPHARIAAMNARSVSVNGRSADVTNSTKSARGTNSVVRRSCSRMIALVPGVSTMWMSLRKSTGTATVRIPEGSPSVEAVAP